MKDGTCCRDVASGIDCWSSWRERGSKRIDMAMERGLALLQGIINNLVLQFTYREASN